jgi:hypothetical protein
MEYRNTKQLRMYFPRNSVQLCQNFGIFGGGLKPQTTPSVRHCFEEMSLIQHVWMQQILISVLHYSNSNILFV